MTRMLLSAFEYDVGGSSPHAYMSELWQALPTLRALLSFDGGWDATQDAVWDVLLEAIEGILTSLSSPYHVLDADFFSFRTGCPPLSRFRPRRFCAVREHGRRLGGTIPVEFCSAAQQQDKQVPYLHASPCQSGSCGEFEA
jgi:hypothetical protein